MASSLHWPHKPFGALTGRHFDFTYALNVKAFLGLVQGVAPRMPPGGSIIALSSEGAEHAMHHYGLVGSSKAALESLCRHLAVELGPLGLRVNVLSPGTVLTEAWKSMPDAESRLAAAAARAAPRRLETPLLPTSEFRRWAAQPVAVAAAAAWPA